MLRDSALLFAVVFLMTVSTDAGNWPQFRGPHGNGVAHNTGSLPADIGPGKNQLWKTPLGRGHSSPVVFGNRVYLSEFRDRKLYTLALDANSGKVLWRKASEYKKLESHHRIGNPATPTPATDGEIVVSFFGSCGMTAYSTDGKRLWHQPMGPFHNQFGATSSPIIIGDFVVTIQDHDTGSYLAAFNKRTGRQLWKIQRPNMRRNYCSPVVWTVNGRSQIVIAGTAHLTGYDLKSGEVVWTVRGLCRVISNTPVIGRDGLLYVASTGGGSASPQPAFSVLLKTADKNKDGRLQKQELPNSPIKRFFRQFDRDGNGMLDGTEYESIRKIYSISRGVALAVKPGGRGDISKTHVRWTATRGLPRNSSPLIYRGNLFMVKDGGVISVLNAKTGAARGQKRLAGRGKYFSSPICADGKIYILDDRGTLTVLKADATLALLHTAKFNESVLATPAIANGRIYVRTAKGLYCFGRK